MSSSSSAITTPAQGTDAWTELHKASHNSKRTSEFYDACQELATKSHKCMHRNGNDKAMCSDYFQAYRDCRAEWMKAKREGKLRQQ